MKPLLTAFVLLAFLTQVRASESVTFAHPTQSSQRAHSTSATCPYRTINYITHGLPQQCLTSTWRSSSPTPSANATEAASTAETSSIGHDVTAVSESGSQSNFPVPTVKPPDSSDVDAEPATSSSPSDAAKDTPSSPPKPPSDQPEEPSPLEDNKFMSFEEWKKQNLHKVEHIGRGKPVAQRKRPVNIHSALDSLGDDAEIDLDFTGFIPDGPDLGATSTSTEESPSNEEQSSIEPPSSPRVRSRSKDAGTTWKERYNYASFDCAANILKTNPEATSAAAVLGENKDSYMLNVCSANNKFLILELCTDITIDTIVLANFEFFSSIFRTFRVSVSDKYPIKQDQWITIGTFEARNTREVQAFLVENPRIWAKYILFEFLTQYGSEYYCPVSLVRVHGTTMYEEVKQYAASEDDEQGPNETEVLAEDSLLPQTLAATIVEGEEQISQQIKQEATSALLNNEPSASTMTTSPLPAAQTTANSNIATDRKPEVSTVLSSTPELFASPAATETCASTSAPRNASAGISIDSGVLHASNTTEAVYSHTDNSIANAKATNSSGRFNELSTTVNPHSAKADVSSKPQSSNGSKPASNATTTDRHKPTSASESHAAAPTMQESFFKSVQKRLQMLEANSSLSLQYIEDQSRALRDAFNKVEQRQLSKTTTFLDYLNTTVLNELRDFRQQYDQLWQSTVIELQMQREQYQQENAAINARLSVLADELIFQKRISILQMVLILICLALVLFARGALNQYLEMPVMQRVLARSPSNRWLNFTTLETPTQSPPVTRDGSFHKRQGILKGHRRMQSEDSVDGSLSPNDIYPSPPTPTSMTYGDQSDPEPLKEERPPLEDPEFDPSMIERPSTSPPSLPSEVSNSPELNGVLDRETIDSRLEVGLNSPPPSPERHEGLPIPRLMVEEATPEKHSKHLTWKLPDR